MAPMKPEPTRSARLKRAIAAAGSLSELARRLGIGATSVQAWWDVPPKRLAQVEEATGARMDDGPHGSPFPVATGHR